MELPAFTLEERVCFAILVAKRVCSDAAWNDWADRWLDGSDRLEASAKASAKAFTDAVSAAALKVVLIKKVSTGWVRDAHEKEVMWNVAKVALEASWGAEEALPLAEIAAEAYRSTPIYDYKRKEN